MKIQVKTYGKLIDLSPTEKLECEVAKGSNVHEVLSLHYPWLLNDLSSISIAINNTLKDVYQEVKDGDHIDLMPPFAGG